MLKATLKQNLPFLCGAGEWARKIWATHHGVLQAHFTQMKRHSETITECVYIFVYICVWHFALNGCGGVAFWHREDGATTFRYMPQVPLVNATTPQPVLYGTVCFV